MNKPHPRSLIRLLALAFFGLALVYGVAAHFTNGVYPEDDAYITYRYVDNLVAGKGLVYNSGVHVFGASSPLYILWLAGLKLLARGTPTPNLAVHLNFIFYLATGFGLWLLLRRLLGSEGTRSRIRGEFGSCPSRGPTPRLRRVKSASAWAVPNSANDD
jgi:peptidoglycan/LPS O-acetylase OafA/YrhL